MLGIYLGLLHSSRHGLPVVLQAESDFLPLSILCPFLVQVIQILVLAFLAYMSSIST
jgi:hypothetical protein